MNANKHEALLPCPFCGGEASCLMHLYGEYVVGCTKIRLECEAHPYVSSEALADAIAAWNTRAPATSKSGLDNDYDNDSDSDTEGESEVEG